MSQDSQGSITYKQALRGLFTVGTSTLMLRIKNNGKGRRQTGIEFCASSPECPKTPQRGANR